MRTKHVYVALLDVGELLPFSVKERKKLPELIKEQERARKELVKFIDILEKEYREKIFYMGMDVIEAKTYERFIFEESGFFEVMTGAPLAMNAHFIDEKKAKKFCSALKKTLSKILPKNRISRMLINSIEVNTEKDQSLTYERWDRIKSIKRIVK